MDIVAEVEPVDDVARDFHVLNLIVAHRDIYAEERGREQRVAL